MSHPTPAIRRSYVDCAFGQLHVTMDATSAVDTRPVILLNSRPRSLLKLLPLLRPRYQGIIVDIPGLGLSSPPPADSTMFDVADCFAELLDTLRIDCVPWFGFYTGHKVATAFAARHASRVASLIVAGKTHSLIPDMQTRSKAMQGYLARRLPDAAIVALEGKYADDFGQQAGFEAIFAANYAFDFAAALAASAARALILEVTTPDEERSYGHQGPLLVKLMRNARAVALPQVDPTGLDLYIGAEAMAATIIEFASET